MRPPGGGRLLAAAAAAFLVAADGGCSRSGGRPEHILLITVDSLVPDPAARLGAKSPPIPALDSLSRESARFPRAYAHAVLTLPSLATIMTGALPPDHGIRYESGYRLPGGRATLAEILREEGFRTGAALGTSTLGRVTGLDRGFEGFFAPGTAEEDGEGPRRGVLAEERRMAARAVDEMGLNWLRWNFRGHTFLWIHYRDLHYPYGPEAEEEGPAAADYALALAALDGEIGRLLDAYRQLGILERTLVILTATHGESLGDHDEGTHSNFLFESTLRVPLLVRAGEALRDRIPPGEADGLASHADLVPTVLDLIGAKPDAALPGRSLARRARGEEAAGERAVYAEAFAPLIRFGWRPLRSVTTADWKLIEGAGPPRLYRIEEDPAEAGDVASRHPGEVARLVAILAGIDPEPDPLLHAGADRIPEDRVALMRRIEAAGSALGDRPAEGREALEGILGEDPGNLHAARVLARMEQRRKRPDRGAEILRSAAGLHPLLADARIWVGEYLQRAGRPPEAVAEFLSALDLEPGRLPLILLAADAESRSGRLEDGVYWIERAVEAEPGAAHLHSVAARFYWDAHDYEKALAHLDRALDILPDASPFLLRQGRCLQQVGRYREAIDALQEAERASPGLNLGEAIGDTYLLMEREDRAMEEYVRSLPPQEPPLRRGIRLADLLSAKGRSDLALGVLEGLGAQFPDAPEVYHTRGEIHLTEKDLDAAEADFQSVLRLDPESPPALYNLARVALIRGDEAGGLELLRRAMARDDGSLLRLLPQDPFFWQAEAGSPLRTYLDGILAQAEGS